MLIKIDVVPFRTAMKDNHHKGGKYELGAHVKNILVLEHCLAVARDRLELEAPDSSSFRFAMAVVTALSVLVYSQCRRRRKTSSTMGKICIRS